MTKYDYFCMTIINRVILRMKVILKMRAGNTLNTSWVEFVVIARLQRINGRK